MTGKLSLAPVQGGREIFYMLMIEEPDALSDVDAPDSQK